MPEIVSISRLIVAASPAAPPRSSAALTINKAVQLCLLMCYAGAYQAYNIGDLPGLDVLDAY